MAHVWETSLLTQAALIVGKASSYISCRFFFSYYLSEYYHFILEELSLHLASSLHGLEKCTRKDNYLVGVQ